MLIWYKSLVRKELHLNSLQIECLIHQYSLPQGKSEKLLKGFMHKGTHVTADAQPIVCASVPELKNLPCHIERDHVESLSLKATIIIVNIN